MTKQLKPFNELTPAGQKARMAKYAQERAEKGLKGLYGNLAKDPVINEIKGGAKQAVLRIAYRDADDETSETRFDTFTMYIGKDKVGTELEKFYARLRKGDFVKADYKVIEHDGKTYRNIWDLFLNKKKEQVPA